MSTNKPVFPTGTTNADFEFSGVMAMLSLGSIQFAMGSLTKTEADAIVASKVTIETAIGQYLNCGELAEKAGKIESKTEVLKTKSKSIQGKRTTTIEWQLNGVSQNQKNYFESKDFTDNLMTFMALDHDKTTCVIASGLIWSCDWNVEDEGLWEISLKAEFSGTSNDKIFIYKDIPAEA